MGHQLERLTHCLNCEQPTSGNFCANCGQENEDQTASLKAVFEDFLDDIIHFDSRLVRTAIPLVIKPGFLTVEYNNGRRVSYLSPYRMYLFVSAVFFLLLAYHGSDITRSPIITVNNSSSIPAATIYATDAKTKAAVLSELNHAGITVNQNGTVVGHPNVTVNLGAQSAHTSTKQSEKAATSNDDDDSDDNSDAGSSNAPRGISIFGSKIDLNRLPKSVSDYDTGQNSLPIRARDSAWLQNVKRNIITFKTDPGALQDRLLDLIPKMTFFLVPLYAASLYPMYLRRKRFYVEHLIYSLHVHSFVFVVFTFLLIMDFPIIKHAAALHGFLDIAGPVLLLSIPVYLYFAMKRVYGQSIMKTLVKSTIAWTNYWILLSLAFTSVLIYAFLMQ